MSKQREWLRAEVDEWKARGIIDADQAAAIRALYPQEAESPWGMIIFWCLGAVVMGLGVILLIAYNWADIPRQGKVVLMLASTVAAHAAGLYYLKFSDWRRRIGEALLLLGTILFGAGIWLVSQAYNIDEHFPNGFLFWALGALAMAWAARSIPQTIAASVLLAIWSGAECFGFNHPNLWALGLIGLGVLPLVFLLRSPIALAVALTTVVFVVISSLGFFGGPGPAFAGTLSIAAIFVALSQVRWTREHFHGGAKVAAFFGIVGFLLCAFLLSFSGVARELSEWKVGDWDVEYYIYAWGVFGLAIALWIALAAAQFVRRQARVPLELWLVPIVVLYAQQFGFSQQRFADVSWGRYVFNGALLCFSVMWMIRGSRDSRLREAVLGCVVFSIWTFARYFDLFDSLASRGFAFLVLGGALFAEGFWYRKRKLAARQEGSS